ncbi:hypothetical protein HK102_006434 [Quaeritorhiza haematococci]|nr:hypothetical protein HK102_006434 [Quaeritorhiza haematococci]
MAAFLKKKLSADASMPSGGLPKLSRPGTAASSDHAKSPTSATPPAPSTAPNAAATRSAASASTTAPTTQPGASPGMLLIRVVEARNLLLPNGGPIPLPPPGTKDEAKLPYCVIEMDKNEIWVAAKEAVLVPAKDTVSPSPAVFTWQHRTHL